MTATVTLAGAPTTGGRWTVILARPPSSSPSTLLAASMALDVSGTVAATRAPSREAAASWGLP